MPTTKDDKNLKEFLEKYKSKRTQIRGNINELVKLTTTATSSTTSSRIDYVEEFPIYISLLQRAPKTADMIAVLKEAPVYRALRTHHDFDETLLQKLEDAAMWEGVAENY